MKEKLLEMLKMQQALNENILKEHDSEKYTDDSLYHALLDELGELNHELKAEWCWWKKTQKPVDRDKVLEEYVDCIHFGLCKILMSGKDKIKIIELIEKGYFMLSDNKITDSYSIAKIMEYVLEDYNICENVFFVDLLFLGSKLGFDFDTIYDAYIKKNKVNYERLKNGY